MTALSLAAFLFSYIADGYTRAPLYWNWCVVSELVPWYCGCGRIIQVDAAHWWWLRRDPHSSKITSPLKYTAMAKDIRFSQSSEDMGTAKSVLLDECEEQFGLLNKLQNEIILADTECNDAASNEAANCLNAITVELEQWQEMGPKLLLTNPDVLLAVGKEELQRLNNDLKMVLSCSQARLDALKVILKREQTWLADKKDVLNAVSDRVTILQHENEKLSEHGVLLDMKRKINNLKDYHGSLMETLSDMLAEHFPLPDPKENGTKKKRAAAYDAKVNLISLSEIIEKLTNKTLESPHDPYVTTDDTFWQPYTEMLLRNGVAIRHPVDCNKIRLEMFF